MVYTIQDIAAMYGVHRSTAFRHIKKLKQANKFEKHSIGKFYTRKDVENIAELLGFSLALRGK